MSFDLIVSAVAQELNLPDLSAHEGGVCQLVVEGSLEITLEAGVLDDSLHLYATVGSTPASGQAEFYAALLEAQLFGKEVGPGISFGLDKTTGEILLGQKLRLSSVTPESFLPVLGEFINWAEHWTERLRGLEPAASASSGLDSVSHFIRA